MPQSHRQLGIDDLTVAVREVRRVTGCLELVVGGSGALVALGARAGELLRTVDFDIGITKEGTLQGVKDFGSKLGKHSEFVEPHGFYVEPVGTHNNLSQKSTAGLNYEIADQNVGKDCLYINTFRTTN